MTQSGILKIKLKKWNLPIYSFFPCDRVVTCVWECVWLRVCLGVLTLSSSSAWAEQWTRRDPLWACFCVVVVVVVSFFFFLSLSGKCNIVCAWGYRAPNVVTIVFSPTTTHISVSLYLILSCFILVSQGFFLLFTRLKEKQCSLYFTFPPASTLHLLSHSVFVPPLPLPLPAPANRALPLLFVWRDVSSSQEYGG